MPRLCLLSLPLVLMGCVEPEAVPQVPPEQVPVDECGASGLQGLVGQRETVLQTMRFGQTVRIIQPGMAVTMDYSATRLNIWIAEGGVIARLTCG